jgi:organic hydroperoxide reductase OsmC/OhrA
MSEHRANIRWSRSSAGFTYEEYNRAHEWRFEEAGVTVPASATTRFRGDADRVDPEAAFVASLSSCHMLTFLAICARRGIVVDAYEDDAVGILAPDEDGKLWIPRVWLRPRVVLAPASKGTDLAPIHRQSHEECFLARSVKTEVSVEPRD